jgi:hypothetical protein
MDDQDVEPIQDIDRSLRKLIRGLTQNNWAEMYEAYKTRIKRGKLINIRTRLWQTATICLTGLVVCSNGEDKARSDRRL